MRAEADHRGVSTIYAGIDEAGMGPLLGPLSIACCALEADSGLDLLQLFRDAGIAVGDSKKIHSSQNLAKLETVALSAIRWFSGWDCATASDVFALLGEDPLVRADVPWMAGAGELRLPLAADSSSHWQLPGCRPVKLHGRLLHPSHINDSYAEGRNKATLELDSIVELIAVLPKELPLELAVDRLGGRAYYCAALQPLADGDITIVSEERGCSSYQFQRAQQRQSVSFLVKGEDRNPLIAAASCIAKYARELHMHLLNSYWSNRMNWLKHTAGYPQDARRWLYQIGSGNVAAYRHQLIRGPLPDLTPLP